MKRAIRRAMLSGDELLREKYPDFEPAHFDIVRQVQPYTLTSPERIFAVIEATRYITRRRIPGAIVECGAWHGGSMMAAARTLQLLGETHRELYLFDTFEGTSTLTDRDVTRSSTFVPDSPPAESSSSTTMDTGRAPARQLTSSSPRLQTSDC